MSSKKLGVLAHPAPHPNPHPAPHLGYKMMQTESILLDEDDDDITFTLTSIKIFQCICRDQRLFIFVFLFVCKKMGFKKPCFPDHFFIFTKYKGINKIENS